MSKVHFVKNQQRKLLPQIISPCKSRKLSSAHNISEVFLSQFSYTWVHNETGL